MKKNGLFRKVLSILLTTLLFMQVVPSRMNVFAEDGEEDDTKVTTGQVKDALDEAMKEERETAVISIPEAVVTLNPSIIIDEIMAAANDELSAKDDVVEVENITEDIEETLDEKYNEAKDALNEAEDNLETAEDKRDEALAELENAKAENEKAQENLRNENLAEEAAQNAQIAADRAEAAATEAEKAAEAAQTAADEAEAAYEEAKKEYQDAIDAINKELAEGVISAEEATKKTEDALIKAEAFKGAMETAKDYAVGAYADAKNAREEATELRKTAQEEAKEAREDLEEAREDLLKAERDLAAATLNAAEETALPLALTAATGAALAAAKVAVEVADGIVNYNEKELADLKEEQAELNEAIEDLQKEIDKAAEEIEKLNKSVETTEEQRAAAQAAYESANAALVLAQKEQEKVEAIIAERDGEFGKQLADEMEAVKTSENKDEAVIKLTETVINYESAKQGTEDEPQYNWTGSLDDGDLSVEITIGNETNKYAVMVDENGTVQYYTYETKTETVVENVAKDEIDPNSLANYTAKNSDGTKLSLRVKNGKLQVKAGLTDLSYEDVKWDNNGNPYYERLGKHSLSITQEITKEVEVVSEKPNKNSNVINERYWDNADDNKAKADQDVQDRFDALKKADTELTVANGNAQSAKKAVEAAEAAREELVKEQQISKETAERLGDEYNALDKKLNGNMTDNIIRGVITGDFSDAEARFNAETKESAELLKRKLEIDGQIIALKAESILANSQRKEEINSEIAKLEEERDQIEKRQIQIADDIVVFNDINREESAKEIKKVLDGIKDIQDGNVVEGTIDAGKAIAEILQSDAISIKTKAAIVGEIEKIADKAHEKALENLKNKAEEQEAILREQAQKVAEAGQKAIDAGNAVAIADANVAIKEIQEADATAKEAAAIANLAIAQNAYAYADRLAKEAKEADDAAKEAYELLKQLSASDLVDDAKLKAAKDAAEKAQEIADAAKEAADEARNAADEAQKQADEARDAADEAHRIAEENRRREDNDTTPLTTVIATLETPARRNTESETTEEIVVEETQTTPEVEKTETVNEEVTPLGTIEMCSLLNLILAGVAVLLGLVAQVKDDKKAAKIAAVVVAVAAVAIAVIFEDLSLPFGMIVNKITPALIAAIVIQGVDVYLGKNKAAAE